MNKPASCFKKVCRWRFIWALGFVAITIISGCISIPALENQIRMNPLTPAAMEAREEIFRSMKLPVPWDKVAAAIALLDDIDGARFDDVTGRLDIWGPMSEAQQSTMPPLLFDDFIVALNVLDRGRNPGVSIGTMSGRIPTQRDINRTLRKKKLPIEYIPPSTKDTHLGSVLYEVDRRLKALAHGEDNITHQTVESYVPGYQPVTRLLREDMDLQAGKPKPLGLWWFVPDATGVALDGYAMKFTSYRMRVEYRAMVDDPAIAQFGTHLSTNFERYAREQVLFRELVRLHKLVQVARWYQESGFPREQFSTYPLRKTATPETTPLLQTLVSSRQVPGPYFGSFYVQQQFIIGGVDLSPRNTYRPAASIPAQNLVPGSVAPSMPAGFHALPASMSPPRYGTLPPSTGVPSFAAPVVLARPRADSYGWTAVVNGRQFAVVSIPVR
ncbi:hypothetical protein JW905_17875 [bacterium]|nr:hypothetical protein [candidate division CSSED10-310 bacterium]